MIEVKNLTKRYGEKVAVNNLSFTVEPGKVTGFLGPNGAGKSTTMRLLLGLDHANSGDATIDGKHYRDLPQPLRSVGALLEAKAVHTGRSAYNHLLCLAQTQGIGAKRVDEVLGLVGLQDVARKRAGGFSLGMGQRLGLAAALLGDPSVLILDEPVNGLDPEGIIWIRTMMKDLAAEGRTVFVSSHLMNEMAVTAEHLIVIGKGQLVADCATQEFIDSSTEQTVLVRTTDGERLTEAIVAEGGMVTQNGSGELIVANMEAPRIAEIAAAGGHVVHELAPQRGSLEEAFMELTRDAVEYRPETQGGAK
ncbi:multidrug ABC transporter ATP-binding protein [Kibdelosporangium aridum]|uniref:Multidrug ABC transporter ATP-binding protein n=1 Tax=Kibdelosporangium aridum TaxID=2030 RepID=A0A428Z4T0_KIBAR|nr:ATP-binding cassette domain-containing protein [Kibdelosporangium aridum]RSM81644.1 multidrug ABC transporter ATP-binding protein [Kibdelosporangium aridum]